MLVDTHCHLYFDDFADDRDAVLARMAEAGVVGALVIGIDPATNAQACGLAQAHAGLAYGVGLHPASEFPAEVRAGGTFDAAAYLAPWWERTRQPVAVGECGIDLHWDTNPLAQQVEVFTAQLNFARERDLPVVVHTREADAETREALEQVPGARGVLHCFNGSTHLLEFAERANARGNAWYVSFAGNLTYKKAQELRDAALAVPLTRLLVESDAPFLAPQAVRGRRNEPCFVVHTASFLAELRGLGEAEMNAQLLANAQCCLGVAWEQGSPDILDSE